MIITETEELEAESAGTGISGVRKTVEEASRGAVLETMEESPQGAALETVEEESQGAALETVEEESLGAALETVEGAARKNVKAALRKREKGSGKRGNSYEVALQKTHIKRMGEWLLPYVIAVVLVIGMGAAVMLATNSRTRQLNQQLWEQYGEYFANGQ